MILSLTLAVLFFANTAGADLGIKNYRQLYSSMAVVTGVPKDNRTTAAYFSTAYRRLSENGNVSGVTAPLLLTTTVLASRFCKEMIQMDSLKASGQRMAHGSVDFTKGPGSLSAEAQKDILTSYAYLFWGLEPTASELSIGLTTLNEAKQGQPETPDSLKKVLMAACTPALASLNLITQ